MKGKYKRMRSQDKELKFLRRRVSELEALLVEYFEDTGKIENYSKKLSKKYGVV